MQSPRTDKKQDRMSIDAIEDKTHRTQMTDSIMFHSCIQIIRFEYSQLQDWCAY